MDCQASQLEAEIEFWRELIASRNPEGDPYTLERMHQALALAEWKLARLGEPGRDGPRRRANSGPERTTS